MKRTHPRFADWGSLTGASREVTSNGSQSKSSVGNPDLDLNDPQLSNELGSELDEESQYFGVDGQHRAESRETNNKPIIKDISDLQNVADLDTTFAYAIDDSESRSTDTAVEKKNRRLPRYLDKYEVFSDS